MAFLDYLEESLLSEKGMREDLQSHVRIVASTWLKSGVGVEKVEWLAEYLARLAREISEDNISKQPLIKSMNAFYQHDALELFFDKGLPEKVNEIALAALALHLMDISEHMALLLYIPELPDMVARSERSAKAARSVGLAQHLRG